MTAAARLKAIQKRLDKARRNAYELELSRNAIVREGELTPGEIMKATGLTKGRVSQIRGN